MLMLIIRTEQIQLLDNSVLFLSPETLANAFGHCKIMNYLTNGRETEM